MSLFYGDNQGKAKKVSKIFYDNSNGKAKEVKQIFLGDDEGKAKNIYSGNSGKGNYELGNFLTFTSETNNEFNISVYNGTKGWDGTLYYSTDTINWNVWDGKTISSKNKNLYIRGLNNTYITGSNSNICRWQISNSSKVACYGNIETLLDYQKVENSKHPVMAIRCYNYMFRDCTSLTKAPELPATKLADYCYRDMFYGCTELTEIHLANSVQGNSYINPADFPGYRCTATLYYDL